MVRKSNTRVSSHYPNKIYFFVCEDEKSMCYYLKGLRSYLKPNIKIDVNHSDEGNTAKEVYKCARNKLRMLEQNKSAYPKGFEIVACFDKDDNKSDDIYRIMENRKDSISKIYNNPCYEYWLYLHVIKNSPVFWGSDDCAKKCLKLLNSKYHTHFSSVKELKACENIFEILKKDFSNAVKNAAFLHFSDYEENYTNAQIILDKVVDSSRL